MYEYKEDRIPVREVITEEYENGELVRRVVEKEYTDQQPASSRKYPTFQL